MSEFKKYLYRFGLVLLIVLPLLYFIQGENAFRVVAYKICLVLIAVGIAELVWSVYFRPVYGKTEDLPNVVRQNIMLFRGLLYAAIVLGFTLGL